MEEPKSKTIVFWLIILIVVAYGTFTVIDKLGRIKQFNTPEVTNTLMPTLSPSVTPTPETISKCFIGNYSIDIIQTNCQTFQKYIDLQKQKDVAAVNKLISLIDGNIQYEDNILKNEDSIKSNLMKQAVDQMNGSSNTCITPVEGPLGLINRTPAEIYQCRMDTASLLIQQTNLENPIIQKADAYKAKYESQKIEYQGYLSSIQNGGIGNGACSDHGGVDCSKGRGGIGQVLCNDDWIDSMVYYFNVKECVLYAAANFQ